MEVFNTLKPFLKEHWPSYLFGAIALIVVDSLALLVPQVFRRFADLAVSNELNSQELIKLILALMLLGFGQALGRYLWRKKIFGTARKLEYWLRAKLFQKYLQLDSDYYHHHYTGDLMANATNDVLAIRYSMGGGVMMIVDALFMLVLTIAMMIWTVGLKISLIALVSLPFITILVAKLGGPIQRRSRKVQNTFSDMSTKIQENFSGVRVIKALAIEEEVSEDFNELSKEYGRKNMDLIRIDGLLDPLIDLISGFSFVAFLAYGSFQVIQGNISLGAFVSVIEYLYIIIWPLIALGLIANNLERGIASMSRLNEIFSQEATVQESKNPTSLVQAKGNIEFRNVSFRYGEDLPWILKDVSFVIKAGQSLAILGKTGAGKSTILSLLLRAYDVTEGEILIDGINIRDLSFEDLYNIFGVVSQESFLFSRSIAENIAFSEKNLDQARVEEAARFAHVEKDIMNMPDGYETLVGERGVTLSGGQKQRVAIARAYYKNAPILVMDDSLSAVDTNTENEILKSLEGHQKGLLVISQRVSSVKGMDEILVLEDAKISQRGNHTSLLQEEGFYKNLYHKQLLEKRVVEMGGKYE